MLSHEKAAVIAASQRAIAKQLREAYPPVTEPLPARLQELLRRLEEVTPSAPLGAGSPR